jgi:redox-sensitive bicupin YhaK (pirin superfamily)
MIKVRKSNERGHFNFGWLDTFHTFSFGDYYDPQHLGFSALRVINEDTVAAGQGFPTHGHKDMEIITYILEGALQHKDSLGTGSVITPGEIQRMTAGSGIQHSEYNPSRADAAKLLQIWILPNQKNLEPSYEQITVPWEKRSGQLRLVGSPDGREGSVTIHQDVELYATVLKPSESVIHALKPQRAAWIQVAAGALDVNGVALAAGDGAAVTKETALKLTASTDTELLLFDLPAAA